MREASLTMPAPIGGHLEDFGICAAADAATTTGTVSARHAVGPAEHAASGLNLTLGTRA
jgi:hypothetical protein